MTGLQRDFAALDEEAFDVVVVGGGVTGVALAHAGASAGLKLALLEGEDFCSATSANSLKILHGGIRYLQHADIARMRESVRARRFWLQAAAQYIRPLRCVVPTRRVGLRSRPFMSCAVAMNDIITFDRNRGVQSSHHIGRGRIVARSEFESWAPGAAPEATAAAMWWDALADDMERMVLTLATRAAMSGAHVVNHAEALQLLIANGRVVGVAARDRLSGRIAEVKAKIVIDTTAPNGSSLAMPATRAGLPPIQRIGAVNLVLNRSLVPECTAIGLPAPGDFRDPDAVLDKGERDLFFVGWRDRTLVGTHYVKCPGDGDMRKASGQGARELLHMAAHAWPAAHLREADVCFVHWGTLPGTIDEKTREPRLEKRAPVIGPDSAAGMPGLYRVAAVKLTTAPTLAEQIVSTVASGLGVRPSGAATADRHWGQVEEPRGTLRERVANAIRSEMALTIEDVVLRRLGCGAAGHPGRETVAVIADEMAATLGWDAQRTAAEIEGLEAFYGSRRL